MTESAEDHINYQRIEQAIRYLEENIHRQPELDDVASQVHLSPFHFHRLFTTWAGISPKRFLQFLTVDFLKRKLGETRNLAEAADAAGLSGQSRVYDLFTTLEAVTPQEYKSQGTGLQIRYGFHDTPFGRALLGITTRGICWLSFLPSDDEFADDLASMRAHWQNSDCRPDEEATAVYAAQIFDQPRRGQPLRILVKGTNFQIKVWAALLKIPMGGVATYQSIASAIDHPKAMQAVGSAVGANHIAYLIPCHRVIRKDGVLGEYRWRAPRKKSIIGWEMAQSCVDEADQKVFR